jgi:cell division protein FtsZ
MVFITAGTGTGAAPVITGKEEIFLQLGSCYLSYLKESASEQALIGIEKLRKQVDSLIVINNNKLREYTGILVSKQDFQKQMKFWQQPQEVLEITHHYSKYRFRDAKTVLYNSGTAIMGSSVSSGENRAKSYRCCFRFSIVK